MGISKNISRIQDWWDDDLHRLTMLVGLGSGGIFTGDVLLTDSDYNDIGEEYPAGTETIYVQVYDSDVTGSLDVVLIDKRIRKERPLHINKSQSLMGTFRGSISTVNASRVLVDEDLLADRIAQLRLEYPDIN